ncbi:MAG TPA: hypothetical protein VKP30_17335 [Polyangiaceae bacterium]|nr:hypothetical protein [Polyangiaceae bacterium]
MKLEDRSLDIAVVGLGQGGGNIATQFLQLGYPVLALNPAVTDLSALGGEGEQQTLDPEHRVYIGIDGYDGAGGDLNYGRECIRENAERIRKAVMEHASKADLVVVTAGLGGGTGSAASELIRVLEDLNLPIMVLATLPTENESGMAKVNAMRGASALVELQGLSWIFVDNSRLARQHGDVGMDIYYETINSVIVGPLDAVNRINHNPDLRPIRTLDGEDLRRLLLAGGVINYAVNELSALDVNAVLTSVREALLSSCIMPAGYALEQVATLGIAIQAPERMLARTPFSFYEKLNEQLKEATGGAAAYLGVYRSRSKEETARLTLICASPQLPDGILAMVNDARREGSTLRDKLHQALAPLDVGELEQFDLFRTNVRTGPSNKPNRRRPVWPDLSEGGLEANSAGVRGRRTQTSSESRYYAQASRPVAGSVPPPLSEPRASSVKASTLTSPEARDGDSETG